MRNPLKKFEIYDGFYFYLTLGLLFFFYPIIIGGWKGLWISIKWSIIVILFICTAWMTYYKEEVERLRERIDELLNDKWKLIDERDELLRRRDS